MFSFKTFNRFISVFSSFFAYPLKIHL
jgi:hypothetical protein